MPSSAMGVLSPTPLSIGTWLVRAISCRSRCSTSLRAKLPVHELADDQRGVAAAEAEAVLHADAQRPCQRFRSVQPKIARWIGTFKVRVRVQPAVLHAQDGGDGLDDAGSAERVAQ